MSDDDHSEFDSYSETAVPEASEPTTTHPTVDSSAGYPSKAGEDLAEALDQLPVIPSEMTADDRPELVLRHQIGKGGMARVRAALQVSVGRDVAVKQVRADQAGTQSRQEALGGLLREAWVTGYLEHPNIVPIYRVGRDDDGEPVIVMKQIEGVVWEDVIADPDAAAIDVDEEAPLKWHVDKLDQVCNAVAFAHDKGVLHRDLKPENVMLGDYGEVYVVDWGIAVGVGEAAGSAQIPRLSDVTTVVGTPAYMAPEMIRSEEDVIGPRSDVYLLGGILHQILTGRPPHPKMSVIAALNAIEQDEGFDFDDDVPSRLADICRKALAADPDQRHDDVRALQTQLRDWMDHRESQAISDRAHEQLEKLRRHTDFLDIETEDSRQMREAFARCRFGFENALRVSPDNTSARDGLQTLLELMIERELQRDGYETAAQYLADLPEPRPELKQKVEALGDRLASREEEYEQLKQAQHEADVDVGRHARSLFVLAIGGLTTLLNLFPRLWEWLAGQPPGPPVPLVAFGVYGASLGGLVWHARERLVQNTANRKMILTFFAVLGVDGFLRVLNTATAVSRVAVAAHKAITIGMAFVVLAISLDKRLLSVGIPFLLVAPLQIAFPAVFLEMASAGVLVGTMLLAWLWWDDDG